MVPYLKAAQYEPKSPNEHVEGVSILLPLESRGGYVFLLAYVSKKNTDNDLLLQLLTDHAHTLANSFGRDANAQHRFEQFLGSLNESIAHTVREGRVSLSIQHFHAAVGIVCEDRMFLSGTGELSALFLHKKPSQRYQIFNLFRGIQTEQALPTWEKPFAVVLDGDLEEGDVFSVTQKDIQHHIPQDDLNSILTALPPKSATEKIRQYFAATEGLLLLIIKAESTVSTVPESYAKPLSDVSIDSFVRGQDETSKLLADQKPDLLGFLKIRVQNIYKHFTEKSRILSDLRRGESRMKVLQGIGQSLLKSVRRTGKAVLFAGTMFANREHRAQAGAWMGEQKDRLQHLPVRTKRSIQLLVVLVVLLVVGLAALSQFRKSSESAQQFTQRVSTIQDIMDRAGGAMIYKDENQARSLYQQATTLLSQLPAETTSQTETAAKLAKDIELAMNELRHVVTIPNPALAAKLNAGDGEHTGVHLILSNKALYATDTQNRIWSIDTNAKQARLLTPNPVSPNGIRSITEEVGSLLVLDTKNQLIAVDTGTGSLTARTTTLTEAQSTVWLHAYANRLYVLAQTSANTDADVLRLNKSGTDYGSSTSWISSKTKPLGDARAFAIDGSLYVLHEGGSVTRFQNGAEVGWNLGIAEPALTEATRIWTDIDSNFIYLLEPLTKRLVVFKKDTGAFVVQYTSDSFTDLTDFVVDEKTQTIYLLSGTNIFTLSAGHLKN